MPAPFAADAIVGAHAAGLGVVVAITEGIPIGDMVLVGCVVCLTPCRLIGPNCPGLISPGRHQVGIRPGETCSPGPVGVISRSGTLTCEIADGLARAGLGQTTCVGVGGDPNLSTTVLDLLPLFDADAERRAVVLTGEICGSAEEDAAAFIAERMTKPVVDCIGGRAAPPGKRMGRTGTIVSGRMRTAQANVAALEAAGVADAEAPHKVSRLVAKALAASAQGAEKCRDSLREEPTCT